MNLIIALVYLDAGNKDIQTHISALRFLIITCMLSGGMSTLTNFPLERPIFIREYDSGTYDFLPYALSKMIVELPFEFMNSIIACLIVYWMEAL